MRVRRRALAGALLAACLLLGAVAPGLAAPPPDDPGRLLASVRATRARMDAQHERLEILAEQLGAARARGAALLAEAAALDRTRTAAARELEAARAELGEHARSAYIKGPGWYLVPLLDAEDPVDFLNRLPLQRAVLRADHAKVERVRVADDRLDQASRRLAAKLVEQAGAAEHLDAMQAQAEALAARLDAELHALDRRVAALIDRDRRHEEAARQAAFARYLATTQPGRRATGLAGPAARRAVAVALAQRGAPYRWGATGPDRFDCSGLTSFAYARAGVAIPRVSRDQYAAFARVGFAELLPGDLVFFATVPRDPATIHHVGMYVGNGLMVEAPYTGATVRTSSIWRPSYAGAVRPLPARAP